MNYLMFRLFARPTLAIIGSAALYFGLAYWLPEKLVATTLFSPLGVAIRENASALPLTVFAAGLFWFLYNLYRFWRWHQGEGPYCPRCGMMMEVRNGRHGAYLGCIRPSCRGTLDYWR